MGTTQLALSTGNKVNSALDNPVNYFASQALSNRASSLSALLDGMGQAIQTLQATNQGITSITSLVHQLTSIANTAKTDLNNTTSVNTLETAGSSGLSSQLVGDLTSQAYGSVTGGSTLTLTDGTNPAATFTIATGETLQGLVDAINQTTGFSASIIYGDGKTLSSATVDGTGAPNGNTLAVGSAYLNIVSTDGQAIAASGSVANVLKYLGLNAASAVVKTGGSDTTDIASYTNVIDQINQTITDSNYQGNNLIDGKGNNLTVQVNELSTNPITVNNVDLTAVSGLGLDANANAWTSSTAIDASVTKINAALTTLQTKATSFANDLSLIQNRQDFTTNLVNTLQNGSSQLVIADKNEEGANMLALQTQQQLGIEALSLSSQANQSVLRLFG
ncbi:MAG: hypothetical protein KGL10_03270 [Alphaproteobacteria bacterium]|nr:hypothetical protein [Alphaproteobacteria bacterium]